MLEVDVIALDAVLLRGLLPDVRLREGTVLPARVLERTGAHGLLWLAGAPVVAELPEGLTAGQRLRLAVAGVDAGKVVLQDVTASQGTVPSVARGPDEQGPRGATAAPPALTETQGTVPSVSPPVVLPLPGGIQARVQVTERDAGGGAGAEARDEADGGARTIALLYDSPRHGRLELRLVVAPGGVAVTVGAAPGPAQALAAGRAGELRAALARALDRPAEVHVGPRRGPLDVRG